MSLIQGVHHIALKCGNKEEFEKTITFYRDILEMEPVRSWGSGDNLGAMLWNGNSMMEIFSFGKESENTGTLHHVALAAADVDLCVERVRKAGYPITIEPKDIVIPANPPFPARIAFCIGPVGETIEFFCEK